MTHRILSVVATDAIYKKASLFRRAYKKEGNYYEHQLDRAGFIFSAETLESYVAAYGQDPVNQEGGTATLKNMADHFALRIHLDDIKVFPLRHKRGIPLPILSNYRRFEVWRQKSK